MIVDDDDRIRRELREALEDEGYDVSEANEAEDALTYLRSNGAPDVMIVELMLGDMDGFECIREIRRDHDVPIIVISSRDDTHDVVAALEAGADDFVTKPFEIKEISARMRALRRRAKLAAERDAPREVALDAHEEAPLMLDREGGAVRRGDEEIKLTLTEFRLLCELADVPGRVLSRAQLLEKVWDENFFGDERIVDVHMRRLRTKIELDPSDPQIVVTVRGLGYRLDLPK
ncbi:DNA-binding response regulator, OmpR family, contains REC and winged-helix (wHTH) domain [Nocardia farcinica]|uniref:Transcriptional regulatory protein AfsQ1 n=2 Tax=Nocardia farcinica TaxID=37329 RepID=A0A0H5NK97_NOCFR|nr:Transcriptional regulatory protein AfsQ1 [Nocardia farcinica]PFX09744.1 Transcriptional regulatory protein AfsQ1 [Nocardia farcinica]CRY75532.1 Transcriptional regulatory protein AfsQ1 [Nocardia farcinica]SIS68458.1 DNA-binding response regulator, OmpR family, contains REC and winged-helix (wHTH) domain [Nocardia farcinica]SUE28602.1 two component system response regulator [Nocardia farcinica]